jgi:DNA-binding HxlR family transcriptional regulator
MAHRNTAECPVETALSIIGGRWKFLIIYQLLYGLLPQGKRNAVSRSTRESVAAVYPAS